MKMKAMENGENWVMPSTNQLTSIGPVAVKLLPVFAASCSSSPWPMYPPDSAYIRKQWRESEGRRGQGMKLMKLEKLFVFV